MLTKKIVFGELLRILDFFHLTHQIDSTRLGGLLDLFCRDKPAIVQNVYTGAGIYRIMIFLSLIVISDTQQSQKEPRIYIKNIKLTGIR